MNINNIFENNICWAEKQVKTDADYFKNLSKGQHPGILYIGCSDSRVPIEKITGVEPGDVFVHRNIANMVPANDLNSRSAVNYAVETLKVNHIIVCGHYCCGGVKAAMQPGGATVFDFWIDNLRTVYEKYSAELGKIKDETLRYNMFVEFNVIEQCNNLLNIQEVRNAIESRGLVVHGWIFDMHSGRIKDLNLKMNRGDE